MQPHASADHGSHLPFPDRPIDELVAGIPTQRVSQHERPACLDDGIHNGLAGIHGIRQRLLAEHIRAGMQRVNGDRRVQPVGCADPDHVRVLLQPDPVIGECFLDLSLLLCGLQIVFQRVTYPQGKVLPLP